MVSLRLAPGSMTKFPDTEACSGGTKNRQRNSPVITGTICVASTTSAPAITG